MEFMLAFGSVGDFIAVVKLIKDIIDALDDCRGSAKNYRDVVRELEILDRTVQQVGRIYDDDTHELYLSDLKAVATSNLAQINETLNSLRDRNRKFSLSLGDDGTKNRARDVFRKIQWKFKHHEVIKFKDEIRGHIASLSMLLGITNIRLTQRGHQDYMEQALVDKNITLDAIKRSGQSMKRYIGAIGKQLISKLSSVANVGLQIQRSTANIMTMMVALSGELDVIKRMLTRLHVDRPLSDEYFILEDSTGRVFPIHLRTITSWDAFEYVLMDRFKGRKGAHRVKKKRYTLKERASNREVNRSLEWDSAFLPHQMVDMSLMCRETPLNAQKGHPASCPWCHEMSPGKAGIQTQCKNWNMFFTRVVELDDTKVLPKTASRDQQPKRRAIRFGEPGFPRSKLESADGQNASETVVVSIDTPKSCDPQCQNLNKKRPKAACAHDSDSDDEDFQGQARIIIVSKEKRPGPFFAAQQETFATAARRLFEEVTASCLIVANTDTARTTQLPPKSPKRSLHTLKRSSVFGGPFTQPTSFTKHFEHMRKTAITDSDESSDEESFPEFEQPKITPEQSLDIAEPNADASEQARCRQRQMKQIQLNTESSFDEYRLSYATEITAWTTVTTNLVKYLKHPHSREDRICAHSQSAGIAPSIFQLDSDVACSGSSDERHAQPREGIRLPHDYVHPREHRKWSAQEWATSHPSNDALRDWTTTTQDWPALLQNGAFDYVSLGKWIYDCVEADCGPGCPISTLAYNLWQVLLELTRHMLFTEHLNFLVLESKVHNAWKSLHIEGTLLLEDFRCHIKSCETSAFGPGPYPEDFKPDNDKGNALAQHLFGADEPKTNRVSLLILEIASFNTEFSSCEPSFQQALGNPVAKA